MSSEPAPNLLSADDVDIHAATDSLMAADPVFARIVKRDGYPDLPPPTDPPFVALVLSITYQQINGAMAAKMYERLTALTNGHINEDTVGALSDEQLRGAGYSMNKVRSLHDLAAKVKAKEVEIDPAKIKGLTNEEIKKELITVRGIGDWSADMFLMFQIRRLDIWPSGDLVLRREYAREWGLAEVPTIKEINVIGDQYRPYRSLVAVMGLQMIM